MAQQLHFNGLNGVTGRPLLEPYTVDQMMTWLSAVDKDEDPKLRAALRTSYEKVVKWLKEGVLGVIEGVDPLNLEEAGWGVIHHPDTPDKVKQALAPLIEARKAQARQYDYDPVQDAGSGLKFRARFGQGPGKVDPEKLPYYLLIVASPEQIPFEFQYGLDAEHAVGRLYFDDSDDYSRYVKRLLDYETQQGSPRQRRVSVFSPVSPDDEATSVSEAELAKPLAEALGSQPVKVNMKVKVSDPDSFEPIFYQVERIKGDDALKPALLGTLTRATQQPSVLFTATHGLGFSKGHNLQRSDQGALVCREWPGPVKFPVDTAIPKEMYLAARDIPNDVDLSGLIVFAFACYSAGTPKLSDFAHFKTHVPQELAEQPFMARLPQKLLSQGALAFVGHVDRAWDYSFAWPGVGGDITTFTSTLRAVMSGKPIGHAFEYFNHRYCELAREVTDTELKGKLHQYNLGDLANPEEVVGLWLAHNDARAYIVFGDPFVRLQPQRLTAA